MSPLAFQQPSMRCVCSQRERSVHSPTERVSPPPPATSPSTTPQTSIPDSSVPDRLRYALGAVAYTFRTFRVTTTPRHVTSTHNPPQQCVGAILP